MKIYKKIKSLRTTDPEELLSVDILRSGFALDLAASRVRKMDRPGMRQFSTWAGKRF